MYVVAIIAAGGRGRRLGGARPKQLLEIGGRSLLDRSLEPFDRSDRIDEVIVVLPRELVSDPPAVLGRLRKPVQVVPGGSRRQESVASGFDRVPGHADVVVVHDAARPFVTGALIARTVDAAFESGAACAALAARDTVKQSDRREGRTVVKATLPRETIYLAQTPQAFRTDVLRDAIALGRRGTEATDEAALAERAGHMVRLVEGEPENIKITTEADLAFGRGLVGREHHEPTEMPVRVGIGYDLHRLVEGRPLILGGVRIPYERGLTGHSDADAVCHAATDAILGAAAAGSIGQHFPDTDPRWAGVSSLELLRAAVDITRRDGFVVENLDVTVIAEHPRLGPYVDRMRAELARAMGIETSHVSVKGKTNEGLGAVGRGEAIAAHAITLLKRRGD